MREPQSNYRGATHGKRYYNEIYGSFRRNSKLSKNLAETVVNTSLRVRPDETVLINTWQHTLPLASQLAYQVRRAGALPLVTLDMDEYRWKSLTELPVENLRKPVRHNLALLDETDAIITLSGPEDPMTYRRVEGPQLAAMFDAFQKDYDKIREKKIRNAELQIGQVTEPRAKAYGFNYGEWKKNVEDASNADYEKMAQLGKKLASTLEHARHVEVTSDGTSLKMEIGAHPAFIEDGIVDQEDQNKGFLFTSIPTGYVTLAPKRGSTEGNFRSDLALPSVGQLIRGITWQFQNGRVVKTNTETNLDSYQKMYEHATGDKDQAAFLAIGLNPAARTGFLADQMTQGTITFGIGENQYLSGENESSFQIGASLSKATVTVDGEPLVHKGKLTI